MQNLNELQGREREDERIEIEEKYFEDFINNERKIENLLNYFERKSMEEDVLKKEEKQVRSIYEHTPSAKAIPESFYLSRLLPYMVT